MKKGIVCFMLLAFLFFIFPSFSEESELELESEIEIEKPINVELQLEEEIFLNENLNLISIDNIQFFNNSGEIEEETENINSPKEYDFKIKLSNLSGYSIVALNNAFIDSHIRGSLWIGNTLTSNEWCGSDDGSVNHIPSETESYIFNNESSMYFQGRTENQSKDAYKKLSAAAVEETRDYWTNIINSFSNDEEHWIYIKPDENGYVNLTKWDYQAQGSDESQQSIEKIYWTNASKVDMGGLAGHLIAPFADINITWCNHRGAIVGWNITTHGEAHINYWEPKIPKEPTTAPTASPIETPAPGKIILQKTLVNDVWHIRCDVMDGTNFHAGGGIWKTDVIMNPTKQTSKEGHRSNKCGDAGHWIIWLDNTGTPFRMDEIKSGATGGTLPTMIFEEVYSPQDLGFSGWGELEPEMTDKVELYKENFKIQKDITTVKPGERIYWITWNGNQRWYHSGVPYVAPPTFTFYIDGEPYPIVAGNYLELEDVLPGAHEIREDVSTDDYIITVFGSNNVEGNVAIVNIVNGETVEVEYVNEIITPPTAEPSTPPSLPTATPSPTIIPTSSPTTEPTKSPTLAPTEIPLQTEQPTPTESPTEQPTVAPIIEPTESPTEQPTESPTIKPTENPTEKPTEKPIATPSLSPKVTSTPKITTNPTLAPTEKPKQTELPTEKPTEQPTKEPKNTEEPTHEPTTVPTIKPTSTPLPTNTPTIIPTSTPTPAPTKFKSPAPTSKPTNKPTPIPTITNKPTSTPTATPKILPTSTPKIKPTNTPRPTITPKPTKLPTVPPIIIPDLIVPTEKPTRAPTPTPSPSPTPEPTLSPEIIQVILSDLPEPVVQTPNFSKFSDEELEELFDIWGYDVPLYGMFQTGDEIPIGVIIAGLAGILCLILYFVLKKYNT